MEVDGLGISIPAIGELREVVVGAQSRDRPVVRQCDGQSMAEQSDTLLGSRPCGRDDPLRIQRLRDELWQPQPLGDPEGEVDALGGELDLSR
jgi:hypothetical protein